MRQEIGSRQPLTPSEVADKSKRIASALFRVREVTAANTILVYLSTASEPMTDDIIDKLLADGKRVFVPVMRGGEMHTAEYRAGEELIEGAFGIREPKNPTYVDDIPDVSVTPMVGYDDAKARLGHGKGCYDKYFGGKESVYKIGLCFERGKCYHITKDAYDIDMDVVITEDKTLI